MSASERRIAELEGQVLKLRHLLGQQLRSDDTIWSDGGVNDKGQAFCTLRWGDVGGQFTAEQMRAFALTLIQTADAAEYDAALIAGARKAEMAEDLTGALVAMAREFRGTQRHSSGEARAQPKDIPPENPPPPASPSR